MPLFNVPVEDSALNLIFKALRGTLTLWPLSPPSPSIHSPCHWGAAWCHFCAHSQALKPKPRAVSDHLGPRMRTWKLHDDSIPIQHKQQFPTEGKDMSICISKPLSLSLNKSQEDNFSLKHLCRFLLNPISQTWGWRHVFLHLQLKKKHVRST